ncbi:hypothetical protein JCM8547_001797 [Rhodosporidiobolus lusitaniae]
MVRFAFAAAVAAAVASVSTALPLADTPAAAAGGQLAFSLPSSDSSASSLVAHLDLADSFATLKPCQRKKLEQWVAGLPEQRLVKLGEDEAPIWITEGEKALLTMAGRRFVDVTDEDEQLTVAVAESEPFPNKLTYKKADLQPLFDHVSLGKMRKFLTLFSGFRTRHYRSDTGKQSQHFLLGQIKQIAAKSKNPDQKIKIREFKHSWGQNSIIVEIAPKAASAEATVSDAMFIVSAHQDSTNLLPFLAAPGADDDGSGSTSLLAAFASLVHSGFVPSARPVTLAWWSAEEGGLLGSKEVAQDYAKRGVKIHAMQQIDMSAYVKPGTEEAIGVIEDFVDPELTQYIKRVVENYADIPWVATKCGYACSDHASFSAIGARSSFTIESTFENSSKDIHSTRDTINAEGFSFDHMKEFSKVAIAMAVELGGGENLFA